MPSARKKKPLVGGQAVIGGVMMKGPKYMAIAVRRPDGEIELKSERVKSKEDRHPIANWWFIRGVVVLGETLVLGYKALNYSANVSLGEEDNLGVWETVLSFVLAIGFALLVFKGVPLLVAELLSSRFATVGENYFLYNLIDGVVKIALFLLYIWAISLLPDVKDVFRYHGAEHKAVNCFEKDTELTVENVKGFSAIHPRCGTTFLIVVLLFSVFVYMVIPSSSSLLMKYLLRLALLPLIAGVSYELIRLGTRFWDHATVRAVMGPCLVVQELTTNEPRDDQLEVSIAALNEVLKREKSKKPKK